MSVIGIDFGNDTCVIGMAARGGIDIILNENSNRKNPTLVRKTLECSRVRKSFPPLCGKQRVAVVGRVQGAPVAADHLDGPYENSERKPQLLK